MQALTELAYLVAALLFIFSLHWMNKPKTARQGVLAGVIGMTIAVLATWFQPQIVHHGWIVVAIVLGFAAGIPLSLVSLTAVPQRTALSHAFGGLAAGLVGAAEYFHWAGEDRLLLSQGGHAGYLTHFRMCALVAEVILGFLTLTGSLMATAKLQEVSWIPQRPVTYRFQNVTNLGLLCLAAIIGLALIAWPVGAYSGIGFLLMIALALSFGVLLIIPIGGADMPTVISILNAYAGLSAVAMGFVFNSKLLITAGALDGSSGFILSIIMCRAMNRSFLNVLFGGFGQVAPSAGPAEQRQYKSETIEGAAEFLEQASLVVIIPGYGMAVSQAQHRIRELYDELTRRNITVKFAIHPVAGRMPGHMNVLLAEAEIPYSDLVEMDEINSEMPQCDVALVIGANDVVNPAAREDKTCPIYGMPIINADRAKMVFAIKRSKNPGFAGIDNQLYFQDRTFMLFGDAKSVVSDLVKELAATNGSR
jgi:H+-translocating NAD(P) transhydrogenase subunit beta